MQYSEETLEYYNNLRNVGGFDEHLKSIGTGIVGSPLCGDVMKLQLKFDENDIIRDVKYKVFGCVSAIAAMEFICEALKGISIDDALKIKNSDVSAKLKLTAIKSHCSVLGKEAIEAAVKDYVNKKEGGHKMITVSEEALSKLMDLVRNHGDLCIGIEIVVSDGGCSGIEYSLRYANEPSPDKSHIDVKGLKFYYTKEDEPLIEGIDINIIQSSVGHGFVVNNKNQLSCENCSCKCR